MTDIHPHIVKRFDEELDQLKSQTLEMARTFENQLRAAGCMLATLDQSAVDRIVEDDALINGWEIELDGFAEFLLSRRQPVAGDLRLLVGALRISIDLERAGDELRSSAKGVRHQRGALAEAAEPIWVELMKTHAALLTQCESMQRALRESDADAARDAIGLRPIVRELVHQAIVDVLAAMEAGALEPVSGVNLIRIAKALERVSAHMQNVGEAVVFIAEGVDLRHEPLE